MARSIHNHDGAPMPIVALQEHLAGSQLVANLILQQAARGLRLISSCGMPSSNGLQENLASSQLAGLSS